MPCDVKQFEIASFFDGELGGAAQASLMRHIATCATCTHNLRKFQAIRDSLKKATPLVPDGLAARIAGILASEDENRAVSLAMPDSRWQPWALAASYAAVALVAGTVGYMVLSWQQSTDNVTRDVVAAHVRALMQDAPYQVASSDQHTVKPWFAGRAEFSPQVRDFTRQGYALVGGRLDYVDGHRVAAMVYRHDKHFIDLMMWPSTGADLAPRFSEKDGFHLAAWIEGGLEARAISDMGSDEIQAFAGLASAP